MDDRMTMKKAIVSNCLALAELILAESERSSSLRRASMPLIVALADFVRANDIPEVTSNRKG